MAGRIGNWCHFNTVGDRETTGSMARLYNFKATYLRKVPGPSKAGYQLGTRYSNKQTSLWGPFHVYTVTD